MRVMFINPECSGCEEMLRAVDIFNKNNPMNTIEIVDTTFPVFEMYVNTVLELLGDEFETPVMIFDHVIINGTSGWKEVLAYLDGLNQYKGGNDYGY